MPTFTLPQLQDEQRPGDTFSARALLSSADNNNI